MTNEKSLQTPLVTQKVVGNVLLATLTQIDATYVYMKN